MLLSTFIEKSTRAVAITTGSICRHRPALSRPMSSNHFAMADRVVGTKPSIWVEFTGLAAQCQAVNIGQGFPDTPAPDFITDLLKEISSRPDVTNYHQYTRGFGHPSLVNSVATLYSQLLGAPVDAMGGVLVTVGAYLALYYAIQGWINVGDEVIVIEPAYDCYLPQIKLAGGIAVPIALRMKPKSSSLSRTSADLELDLDELASKFTSKTKMLILNNPHNPTGKLYSRADLERIAELVRAHSNVIVVADEVYEWIVYPDAGNKMIRFASLPDMYERTITIGSAGKAFSVTGWKLGWALGPEQLLWPLKCIHQNCVFTCSTPTQEAVARAFELEMNLIKNGQENRSYLQTTLVQQLLPKRDAMAAFMRDAGFDPIVPQAGYFMLADFSNFDGPFRAPDSTGDPVDFRFVRWLCREKRLAAIPPSAFYSNANKHLGENFVRICFFKKDETLAAAAKILKDFSRSSSV